MRLSSNQIGKLNSDLEIARGDINKFNVQRTAESGDLQKRLIEYENKVALLSQEIERLTDVANKKTQ